MLTPEEIELITALITLISNSCCFPIPIIISLYAVWYTRKQTSVSEKDLSLTAYSNAVNGILGLKQTFAANEGSIFRKQMELSPGITTYIPEYMQDENIPTFLAFAGGMWRFSYVFSVMNRWEELGLTQAERDGLENEMLLWLRAVPGFYDVYEKHTKELEAHNPAFLKYLEENVYNADFKPHS